MDRQLFILDDAVWDSMSFDDVKSTVKDMCELDIYYQPCQYYDVMTKGRVIDLVEKYLYKEDVNYGMNIDKRDLKFRYNYSDDLSTVQYDVLYKLENSPKFISMSEALFGVGGLRYNLPSKEYAVELFDYQKWKEALAVWVEGFLLVCLAAKNSEKTVKQNKLAKLGIGKKKDKYAYTTTITIGKITETEGTGEGGGWTVRPHLRRGHIREQRYGPNRQYSKKVFIQPVFVNAVEGFVDQRKAYNVRVAS